MKTKSPNPKAPAERVLKDTRQWAFRGKPVYTAFHDALGDPRANKTIIYAVPDQ